MAKEQEKTVVEAEERTIDRLIKFVDWLKAGKVIKSRSEFERKCGLSYNYLYNTMFTTKSSIGSDQLAKMYDAFPMLNIKWIITGKGAMIESVPEDGYKQAYEDLRKKLDKLKKEMDKI